MDAERFRYYTAWHAIANERRYAAPAPPWRSIRVSPAAIEQVCSTVDLRFGLGRVRAGPWDRPSNLPPLADTAVHRGLTQRFGDGLAWEDTALYDRARRRFERGESVRGYESLAAFRSNRCSYLDDLYESIGDEGYQPNRAAAHEAADADNPYETAHAHHLEPLVGIRRDGELAIAEGFHRLVLADLLDVDEIPVQVLRRHADWQALRDRLLCGDHDTDGSIEPADLDFDHPDLADLRLGSSE